MIWAERAILLTALVLMASFDISNNLIALDSGIGAVAFTCGSIALAITRQWLFIPVAVACSVLSGIYNYEAIKSPAAQQETIQREITEIRSKIDVLEKKIYSDQQILDCFNEVYVENCKSADYKNSNTRTWAQIDRLQSKYDQLYSQLDLSYQKPDSITANKDYMTAFIVPIALPCFAWLLFGTFGSKKSKPLFKRLKLSLNFLKPRIKPVQTEVKPNLNDFEREKILRAAYVRLYKQDGEAPAVKKLYTEVKREKGLSAYKYTRDWFNSLDDETRPVVEVKRERPLQIVRPTNGGQIV